MQATIETFERVQLKLSRITPVIRALYTGYEFIPFTDPQPEIVLVRRIDDVVPQWTHIAAALLDVMREHDVALPSDAPFVAPVLIGALTAHFSGDTGKLADLAHQGVFTHPPTDGVRFQLATLMDDGHGLGWVRSFAVSLHSTLRDVMSARLAMASRQLRITEHINERLKRLGDLHEALQADDISRIGDVLYSDIECLLDGIVATRRIGVIKQRLIDVLQSTYPLPERLHG